MSRVDKVIFSTHAIMANGGLVTHTGAYMIALAAHVNLLKLITLLGTFSSSNSYWTNVQVHSLISI